MDEMDTGAPEGEPSETAETQKFLRNLAAHMIQKQAEGMKSKYAPKPPPAAEPEIPAVAEELPVDAEPTPEELEELLGSM